MPERRIVKINQISQYSNIAAEKYPTNLPAMGVGVARKGACIATCDEELPGQRSVIIQVIYSMKNRKDQDTIVRNTVCGYIIDTM